MDDRVGLCQTCLHARKITSGKGSYFWLCRKSEVDPAFKKYPSLPVLQCSGFSPGPSDRLSVRPSP